MDKDRQTVYLILKDIEERQSWSNLALNKGLKDARVRSEAFVREMVYGILRNRMLLDFNIDRYLKKPGLRSSDRILLRMGFYQLAFMNHVPDHGAVNETVELASVYAKGRQGFINGVLRAFIRDGRDVRLPRGDSSMGPKDIKRLSVQYSCSPWIIELWLGHYGPERLSELLGASLSPAPLCIRSNPMKQSREELMSLLGKQGFECRAAGNAPNGIYVKGSGLLATELFKIGCFSVQGEASQMAAYLLEPGPGDSVIDMCAAPGGKACAMAELMGDRGRVRAFDLYPARAELIKAAAGRLGLESVQAAAADGTVFDPALEESADCVLADVPCSGLGTLRQKPEIKLAERPEDMDSLPGIQLSILENAGAYCKPGGRLLYSTCTVNPAENQDVAYEFLKNHPQFAVMFEKQFFQTEGGCDGFYICLMRKNN